MHNDLKYNQTKYSEKLSFIFWVTLVINKSYSILYYLYLEIELCVELQVGLTLKRIYYIINM